MSVQISSQESALTSLAILKVNHDRDRDYISNFIPFVAQALRDAPQDEVSLHEVQAAVLSAFSLNIPQGALSTILHRACRNGYVEKSYGIYRRDTEKLARLDMGAVRADVTRQQAALLDGLAQFASAEYEVSWGAQEAEAALLGYLSTRATAVLTAAVDGRAIDTPPPVDHAGIIVNSFVAKASESDPTAFDFLVTLVKGSMLADVLYLPGAFDGARRKFGGTEFFLDTAVVLRAIGFSTPELAKPAQELLELLQAQNVSLRIFEHTRDEIVGAMDHSGRALRPGSQISLAPPAEFLRSHGWRASDVEDFIAKIPKKLSALGIEVVPKPDYVRHLGIDEKGLEETLHDALPGQREEAARKDVDSLAAIHRLRAGRTCQQLENCAAVFVTTNGAFVREGTQFFRDHVYGEQGVSPVIHVHDLTTIVWLKSPTAAPDLPRLQVIADSFAALNPPDELWRRYNDEIARLRQRGDVTTEEFHVLRYSIEARRALQATTFGDPNVFTEGSVPAILEKARGEITSDLRRRLEDEKAAKEQARSAQQEAETQRSQLQTAVAAREAEREAAVIRRAQKSSAAIAKVALVISASIVAFGTFALSDFLLPQEWKDVLPPLEAVSVGVVVLLSVASAVFGTSLSGMARTSERWLTPRIARLLRSLAS
jgi:hypothetical protein